MFVLKHCLGGVEGRDRNPDAYGLDPEAHKLAVIRLTAEESTMPAPESLDLK